MTVVASTALDPIFALFLGAWNGIVAFLTQLGSDKDSVVSAILVIVTIGIVYKFGDSIVSIFDKLFNSLTGSMRKRK